jgi:3-methyladenine DNA glycosylase AlkD
MRVRGAGGIIDRWARDADFWLRRSALLVHLLPLREGRGSFERFARHADAMLEDSEFFVRKAIGWVLRAASRRDPDRVAAWLLPRAALASGVTLREAVKHLPARRRSAILPAAGGRRSRLARRGAARAPPAR